MKSSPGFINFEKSDKNKEKMGPFRLLRFSTLGTENDVLMISRRERTVKLNLPRVKTAKAIQANSTEWAEKSLRLFEQTHQLSTKSSRDELVSIFKASLKEQFNFVSPAIDRNVQRLNMTRYKVEESSLMTPFVRELAPPRPNLEDNEAALIDLYYPNPSYSKAGNRIMLPGDYDFDLKRYEKLAKSQQLMNLLKSSTERSATSSQLAQLEEPNDEEFILNLMKKQHEAKSLPKPKENLLSGFNMFWSLREIPAIRPEAREGASLVAINRRFYLFAGQGLNKRNDVKVLNPDTWLWAPMNTAYTPKGRIGHTANAYKNKIVVFGGWAHYSQRMGIRRCFRKVYVLRIKQGSWYSRVGSGKVPKPRRCHMAAVLGRSLIVFGGLDSMSKRLRTTYVYDLKEQDWLKVPTNIVPGGRSNGSLTPVFHSSILNRSDFSVLSPPKLKADFIIPGAGFYLFGGLNDDDKPSNDLHILEMKEGSLIWAEVSALGTPPMPRYDHTTGFVNGFLIVFGGRNDSLYSQTGNSCLNDVHVLKIETLSWETALVHGAVPDGRWGHCSVVYGSKLLIWGGINHLTYLPSDVHILETDQSYVTELVRQQAEIARKQEAENTALKRTSMMFGSKVFTN